MDNGGEWGSKGNSGKGDGIGNEVDGFHCDGACFSAGLGLGWMNGRKFQAVRFTSRSARPNQIPKKIRLSKVIALEIIIDADSRWLWESRIQLRYEQNDHNSNLTNSRGVDFGPPGSLIESQ